MRAIIAPINNDLIDIFVSSRIPAMLFKGYVMLFLPIGIKSNRFGTSQIILLSVRVKADLMKKKIIEYIKVFRLFQELHLRCSSHSSPL